LKNIYIGVLLWMLKLLNGRVEFSEIDSHLNHMLASRDLAKLYNNLLVGPRYIRNRAQAKLLHLYGFDVRTIGRSLFLGRKSIENSIRRFQADGVDRFLTRNRKPVKKADDLRYQEALISLLHSPPAQYGINRTTWTMKLMSRVLGEKGYVVGHNTVGKLTRNAGYRFRKARHVLTSNDPNYRQKLKHITKILSTLGPNDRFFSIDEFGPFAIKKKGGKRLVRYNEYPAIPQWQRSKGFLVLVAALELSTNQVTHFYSKKKDTEEMLKLLDILLEKYSGCRKIYLSWDGASWHSSKKFLERVGQVNRPLHRKKHGSPLVKLAPLPARAQFLNVIESVFSGMATAIIHNSDYRSVDEAKSAINRYFRERNEHFRKHPWRAGNKIWGKELVPARFKEGQNCKPPKWQL
jgi:transposase